MRKEGITIAVEFVRLFPLYFLTQLAFDLDHCSTHFTAMHVVTFGSFAFTKIALIFFACVSVIATARQRLKVKVIHRSRSKISAKMRVLQE